MLDLNTATPDQLRTRARRCREIAADRALDNTAARGPDGKAYWERWAETYEAMAEAAETTTQPLAEKPPNPEVGK